MNLLFRVSMLLMLVAAPAAGQAPPPPVKVLIAVDMEGITGVVSPDQLGPTGFEYPKFREFMTAEALAAVDGARAGGATEVVVVDSHGNGLNLLIDRFPDDVRIVRSWPRPLGMVQGLDSSFAAVVFIGFHSGTSNLSGVRAHTMSSANYTGLRLDGREVSESGWAAHIAGYFGVPVVFISGDGAAIAELKALVPGAGSAQVKEAISFHSALTLTPAAGQALIRGGVERAVRDRGRIRPVAAAGPHTVELSFKHYRAPEALAMLPLFERTASHTIRFRAATMAEASRILGFIGEFNAAGLTP